MGKRSRNKKLARAQEKQRVHHLHPETKRSIWGVVCIGLAVLLTLAGFEKAGPAGHIAKIALETLVGVGYIVLPLTLLFLAGTFLFSERQRIVGVTLLGGGVLVLSILGLIEIISPKNGGWLGLVLGSLRYPFGNTAAIVLNVVVAAIAILVAANIPLRLPKRDEEFEDEEEEEEVEPVILNNAPPETKKADLQPKEKEDMQISEEEKPFVPLKTKAPIKFKNYVAPPLSLLQSSNEKPTTGDLRANANIIKRTLEGFGISVEMGEIAIGPKVTRYTLKPAEGVKLSRITALGQDLALALAAHPIRIEAPIPGKSLVGIEVPNKSAALVRLGNLMQYLEFGASGSLGVPLGRDVTGEPMFVDIERMPHLLVAGATGSGKSVAIHSMIVSLLYKNSPQTLRLVLIDPKRVELSIYENIPHLISPVVTDNKKAVGVFRWALKEMDKRYDMLLKSGSRDIKSYNAKNPEEILPYLLVVVDELADLMTSYGRDVEGSIIRLAQMARATGIHLVLATQRPSVEVITGLIKANITSRVAFQVASQVDSRTILDTSGAEKLLGGGDLLFISASISKPKRIQGAYIPEEEIHSVADFIRENNERVVEEGEEVNFSSSSGTGEHQGNVFDEFANDSGDELYEEAVETVKAAGKASASLLQRRLKVGYARAARLLDLMEEKGIIGPGEGAKPREVYGVAAAEEEVF